MEYNTSRTKLMLPEYGRNVQNMIAHAMEVEDREERNRAAQAIIKVMGQLNPHLRDVDDYRHKLWTHLFVMSNFQLDVDSPYEIPKQESLESKPEIMQYPTSKIRYGHYGQYTQKVLEVSKEVNNEEEKAYLTKTMANFMKKQFLMHNNNAVENQVIVDQMSELSKGELKFENADELTGTNQLLKTLGLNNRNNNNRNNRNNKKKRTKKRY